MCCLKTLCVKNQTDGPTSNMQIIECFVLEKYTKNDEVV